MTLMEQLFLLHFRDWTINYDWDSTAHADGEVMYTATVSGSELIGGSDPDDGDATTP